MLCSCRLEGGRPTLTANRNKQLKKSPTKTKETKSNPTEKAKPLKVLGL